MAEAETYAKSKLKRNKPSVKDVQPGMGSRGTLKGSHTAETGRSVWWTSEQLPAVESLWALCALPCLNNQHRDLVPDLPHPSTARPTALKSGEQRWCDLGEDVAPFPEPSPPSPRAWSSPSHSPRELSVQTEPVPDPADRELSSRSSQRPRPSLHGWEGPASSAGPSRVGGDEGRRGRETGPVDRQLLTDQAKVSDSRVPLQRKGEDREEEEGQREGEEEEGQSSVGGAGGAAGGAGLQSCPMCLLDFPVGFTQMDCDGHLAQCLSEVNVDVTW